MRVSGPLLRRVGVAYAWSFVAWAVIDGLISVQQATFEHELGRNVSFSHVFILLSIRFFDFALLTPPLFFLVRRATSSSPSRQLGPSMLQAAGFIS